MTANPRRLADAVIPIKGSPAKRFEWAAVGLPDSGWVMVTDTDQCELCPDDSTRPCNISCGLSHSIDLEARTAMGVCYHCDPAPCADACPTGSIQRSAQGVIEIDQEVCNGCDFCVDACPTDALVKVGPYSVPVLSHAITDYSASRPYGSIYNTVAKCTLCEYRLLNGEMPVCSDHCPHGAIWVGNLDRNTATNGRAVVRLSDLLANRRFEMVVPGQRVFHLHG